jgi:mRNA interferase MazF
MKPGDVVLADMQQVTGGGLKLRPALVLAMLPGPYQDLLLCGISTQAGSILVDWDERIEPGDSDFPSSGLHYPSVIRLSFLISATRSDVGGTIGYIDPARLTRLRQRISDHLRP